MTDDSGVNRVIALGLLAEAPGREQARVARQLGLPAEPERSAYTDLFVVQLYPYASVYLSDDGRLGGPKQGRIADFWRVLGQPVPRDPDHIATLLATCAQLIRHTSDEDPRVRGATRELRHGFFWEHLASWLPPFLVRVRELGSASYAAWSALLLDALEAEAGAVGPPSGLPHALRESQPAVGDRSAAGLADTLFAPARSGVILTRADLHRCARDLQLPVRVAERRYTLRSLLAQDGGRVAAWLAAEAARQADNIRLAPAPFAAIAEHWERRARATAARLREIAQGMPAKAATP